MKEWGLQNVALEKWPNQSFQRGWTNDKFYLAAVSPQAFPIPGTPTPGRRARTASCAAKSCSSPRRRRKT